MKLKPWIQLITKFNNDRKAARKRQAEADAYMAMRRLTQDDFNRNMFGK